MATLPDLDTDKIGIIAFWNCFDHPAAGETVDDIDPTDVLSEGTINTYEQYDNGVQGTMEVTYSNRKSQPLGNDVTVTEIIHFRVKDDGWFITWIDRTNDFGADNDHGQTFIDIANDWTDYNSNVSPANHFLERKINALADDLGNWGIIDYNAGDVGIYSYEYSDATVITQMSEQLDGELTAGVSYTEDTTRYYHAAGGCRYQSGESIGFTAVGNIASDAVGDNGTGVRDVIDLGLMPDSGTYYCNDSTNALVTVAHQILWS